jgi:tRNA threonylcarbamoyladenosine biosynthesis protein TsaE
VAVNSPTFTLINEYRGGRMPVYHMDLYRLGDPAELYELGLWEYYDGDGVCLVEWCDRFDDLWPADAMVIRIELLEGERRRISVTVSGEPGEALLEQLSPWTAG